MRPPSPRPPRPRPARQGQLTVELLLLTAAALALLMVASLSAQRILRAEGALASRGYLSSDLDALGAAADEICVLGPGNARVVELARLPLGLGVEAGGRTLVAWRTPPPAASLTPAPPPSAPERLSRPVLCALSLDEPGAEGGAAPSSAYLGQAYLWFDADFDQAPRVRISPRPRQP